MTRQVTVLLALVAVLVVAAFWFFVYQPANDDLAAVEQQVADVQAQQVTTQQRIAELEAIRADAPTIEAALVGAGSLVPSETALPATLRQLQLAADDAGVTLLSISPGLPSPIAGLEGTGDLAEITLTLTIDGSYFQVVDLLRRMEDPTLVARGVVVDNVTLAPAAYPDLTGSISARIFAQVAPAPAPPEAPPPDAPAEDAAGDAAGDEPAATEEVVE